MKDSFSKKLLTSLVLVVLTGFVMAPVAEAARGGGGGERGGGGGGGGHGGGADRKSVV